MPLCRLDCQQPTDSPIVEKRVIEYEGPVKILLVESDLVRANKKYSFCVCMGYFAMGGVVMPIIFYSLQMKLIVLQNMHVLLCSLGYYLYIGGAFLGASKWNGSSSLLRVQDRKMNYVLLKSFGFIAVAIGTASASIYDVWDLTTSIGANYTLHSATGYAAGALGVLDVFTIPISLYTKGKCCTRCTEIFGVPSFVMSAVSLIIAVIENNRFKRHLLHNNVKAPNNSIGPAAILYIGLVIYFVLVTISSPIIGFFTCK